MTAVPSSVYSRPCKIESDEMLTDRDWLHGRIQNEQPGIGNGTPNRDLLVSRLRAPQNSAGNKHGCLHKRHTYFIQPREALDQSHLDSASTCYPESVCRYMPDSIDQQRAGERFMQLGSVTHTDNNGVCYGLPSWWH